MFTSDGCCCLQSCILAPWDRHFCWSSSLKGPFCPSEFLDRRLTQTTGIRTNPNLKAASPASKWRHSRHFAHKTDFSYKVRELIVQFTWLAQNVNFSICAVTQRRRTPRRSNINAVVLRVSGVTFPVILQMFFACKESLYLHRAENTYFRLQSDNIYSDL